MSIKWLIEVRIFIWLGRCVLFIINISKIRQKLFESIASIAEYLQKLFLKKNNEN